LKENLIKTISSASDANPKELTYTAYRSLNIFQINISYTFD